MAKQRKSAYGSGGIYDDPQRPGRKIVIVPWGHGKTKRRRAVDRATAERKYADLLRQRAAGLDRDGATKTLIQLVNEWREKVLLPRQVSTKPYAPKTVADIRDTIERYLLPDWGNHRMEEFKVPLILDIYATLCRKFSEATADRALSKLSMLLETAVDWEYIAKNPVKTARKQIPTYERPVKPALTIEETYRLLKVVANHRLCVLYWVGLTLGLRLGELLGLQWGDINWDQRTITIRRQAQQVGGKKALRDKTKTPAGARVLPLPSMLYERLRWQWEHRSDSIFIFPNEDGGMFSQGGFERHFRGGVARRYTRKDGTEGTSTIEGVRQKAGLPSNITPHSFRHTASTRLMELGVPEEIRQAIFGWGKHKIQHKYGHGTIDSMRDALERLEREVLALAA